MKLSKATQAQNTYIMRPRYAMFFWISFYVTLEVDIISLFDVIRIKG